MTPKELFATFSEGPQWIHGSDVGIDEEGGLWVKAGAELGPLSSGVQHLGGRRISQKNFREYSILTSQAKTGLNPRDRSEPVWKYVHTLESGSIGPEWLAVDRRETEKEKERCSATG